MESLSPVSAHWHTCQYRRAKYWVQVENIHILNCMVCLARKKVTLLHIYAIGLLLNSVFCIE